VAHRREPKELQLAAPSITWASPARDSDVEAHSPLPPATPAAPDPGPRIHIHAAGIYQNGRARQGQAASGERGPSFSFSGTFQLGER
jgi:hypothetical protein